MMELTEDFRRKCLQDVGETYTHVCEIHGETDHELVGKEWSSGVFELEIKQTWACLLCCRHHPLSCVRDIIEGE